MQVKSIAECSNGSILQYFRPPLSYHFPLRPWFSLFLSGHLRQVLLYTNANVRSVMYFCIFSQLPTVVSGPGTLPHYQLGDLGLIPRPKQTIPTSLDKMRVLSATTRLGGLRKVLCRSVGIQTVSAPKVKSILVLFLTVFRSETQGTKIFFQYCTCPAGRMTIFTHPAKASTCPLKAYAIKNIRE